MIRPEAPPEIGAEHIEALLEFLPLFESKDFRAYTGIRGGYYRWHPDMERFHDALYENHWVISFDWSEWQGQAADILNDDYKLNAADAETLRKVLTTITRKERFCANVFPIACHDGTMKRILRRLKALREELREAV